MRVAMIFQKGSILGRNHRNTRLKPQRQMKRKIDFMIMAFSMLDRFMRIYSIFYLPEGIVSNNILYILFSVEIPVIIPIFSKNR